MARRQKRFEVMDERAVNKDGFVTEWPEVGLIAMGSPNDPIPSVKVQNGVIVEMDGKKRRILKDLYHYLWCYFLLN